MRASFIQITLPHLISLLRCLAGMHSPADVQGGLILGALCLRVWEWIGPTMFVGWMQAAWTPATAFVASVAFLLCQPRPAKPVRLALRQFDARSS